ncbi:MAG: hypothetical protein ACRDPF_18160, partial [Streptosporangiaceae bacterium]
MSSEADPAGDDGSLVRAQPAALADLAGRDLLGAEARRTAARLDELLLGAARDHLGDGPLVVVPPGPLNAVPRGLLPSLAGRAVSVAPSARA